MSQNKHFIIQLFDLCFFLFFFRKNGKEELSVDEDEVNNGWSWRKENDFVF